MNNDSKREYRYLNPGVQGEINVWSNGANGLPGGDGINKEIGNWER